MGVDISNWKLAKEVSCTDKALGVVSGTGLPFVLARKLQEGEEGGHIRRAIEHFPFTEIAKTVYDKYFIRGGKAETNPYMQVPRLGIYNNPENLNLTILSNFVEVWLAKEGHNNPVGINYLEKIQIPHLPSLLGAMLAGVNAICTGAGVPSQIPDIIERLSRFEDVSYILDVEGADKNTPFMTNFDPKLFGNTNQKLFVPEFYPIISSHAIAQVFANRCKVDGFIIEGYTAGGHNAPPRGKIILNENGEPIYGPRDEINLEIMRKLGFPFWLAGGYGSPQKLQEALAEGAVGIQAGTLFALCKESGLVGTFKQPILEQIANGKLDVRTSPDASPTGYPFKVALINETLTQDSIYNERPRVCDIGMLANLYLKPNGEIGYRCPAEPVKDFLKKGGTLEKTVNSICLCNALGAATGKPQMRKGIPEPCIITLGKDFNNIALLLKNGKKSYSAKEAIEYLLR